MNNNIIKVLAVVVITGCGGGKWSEETKAVFIDACIEEANSYADKSSSYSYCECCVVELEKIYDEESFQKEEAKILMGLATSEKFNNDMANTVLEFIHHIPR